jgi:hypothetical protein
MSESATIYESLAEAMETGHGVVQAKAFGMPGLKTGSKVFAGLFHDAMVFKLGAGSAAHVDALALPGARLWDPSGMGRPFKDWVEVPPEHSDRWPELAELAMDGMRPA